MNVLAIDVGSSSVKAGLLRGQRLVSSARCPFPTHIEKDRAEIDPADVLRAIAKAIGGLGAFSKKVDVIAIDTLAPSWIVMDKRGRALTPIVTHQDRRSIKVAEELEQRIGKKRHLHIAGSRPVPGGISSTTCAWFIRHEKALMRKADLIGHLTTYLHRQMTGARVVDPSHASFMGLYSTILMSGWNNELCAAVGVSKNVLPEILDADQVAGKLLPSAAQRLGLRSGIPVLTGMIDTGSAMLLAGARSGQLVNVVGTTDVLALCTNRPRPDERLLTRALGVGKNWVSVGTIASAGSTVDWARRQFFADWSDARFYKLLKQISRKSLRVSVKFEPYMAGDRSSVEQRSAELRGLSLATTREQILSAIVDALAAASADRLALLKQTGTPMHRDVLISGGGGGDLAKIMHRDWPGNWRFTVEKEATMRGLAVLAEMQSEI
ncbi:MAG TPA: FGGY family carbohydrate kinase [Tepidisphaeraceae bacterium]|nr:FGGY family carbohydrate kinase [Tepidisphaeraceae bacterium]